MIKKERVEEEVSLSLIEPFGFNNKKTRRALIMLQSGIDDEKPIHLQKLNSGNFRVKSNHPKAAAHFLLGKGTLVGKYSTKPEEKKGE